MLLLRTCNRYNLIATADHFHRIYRSYLNATYYRLLPTSSEFVWAHMQLRSAQRSLSLGLGDCLYNSFTEFTNRIKVQYSSRDVQWSNFTERSRRWITKRRRLNWSNAVSPRAARRAVGGGIVAINLIGCIFLMRCVLHQIFVIKMSRPIFPSFGNFTLIFGIKIKITIRIYFEIIERKFF
jgi:hypothetical protein